MLNLTLHREYFDLILAGAKTREFRKNTPHYRSRIRDSHGVVKHDRIKFTNGYGKHRPWMIVELRDVTETEEMFTLYLGKILDRGNIGGRVTKKVRCDACGYFVCPVELDDGMLKCPVCNGDMI